MTPIELRVGNTTLIFWVPEPKGVPVQAVTSTTAPTVPVHNRFELLIFSQAERPHLNTRESVGPMNNKVYPVRVGVKPEMEKIIQKDELGLDGYEEIVEDLGMDKEELPVKVLEVPPDPTA